MYVALEKCVCSQDNLNENIVFQEFKKIQNKILI